MDRSIQPPRNAEVCVVGAGPAGLVICHGLARAGRRVLLLESGGLRASRQVQTLNEGEHEGEPYQGLVATRHRQVGGTVNIWNTPVENRPGAKYVPLDPHDLAEWPIIWNDLEPYYVEAQQLCGLGPFEYGAEQWATDAFRPFGLEGTGLTSRVYQFGAADRFSTSLVGSLRQAEGFRLCSSTTVLGLLRDHHHNRVAGVQAVDGAGNAFDVRAETVVLACGAVENARLLLLAGLGGNGGSPWLGRCFMEHPRDYSLVLVPDSPAVFSEAAFYDMQTAASGALTAGRLALTDEALRAFRLPNASLTLLPRPRSHTRRGMIHKAVRAIHRVVGVEWRGGYGWSRVRSPATAFDAFSLVLNMEQRPDPRNRIELGSRCDRFGNPLPRLILRWTEAEQAELERLRDLLAEWFRAAGLGRLLITRGHRPDLSAHHHAGTTRMGMSLEEGVVDPNGLVFGSENLYLAGASVFPSAGFANPMLTIVALSLRLSRHLCASVG